MLEQPYGGTSNRDLYMQYTQLPDIQTRQQLSNQNMPPRVSQTQQGMQPGGMSQPQADFNYAGASSLAQLGQLQQLMQQNPGMSLAQLGRLQQGQGFQPSTGPTPGIPGQFGAPAPGTGPGPGNTPGQPWGAGPSTPQQNPYGWLQGLFGNGQGGIPGLGLNDILGLQGLTPQQQQLLQQSAFAGTQGLGDILSAQGQGYSQQAQALLQALQTQQMGNLGAYQDVFGGQLASARTNSAADTEYQREMMQGQYGDLLRQANEAAAAQGLAAGPGMSSIEAANQSIAGRDLNRGLEAALRQRTATLSGLESQGLGELGGMTRQGLAQSAALGQQSMGELAALQQAGIGQMGATGREAAGRLSQYQFDAPYMERQYRQGLQNQLMQQGMGIGQLGLQQQGLYGSQGIEQQRLALDRMLGMGGLDLQRQLGLGNLALGGRQLDIQQQLGLGEQRLTGRQLDIQEGLGQADIALRRDLGMENVGIARAQIDLMRTQGIQDNKLREAALGLEQNRESFNQMATLREMEFNHQITRDQFEEARRQFQRQAGLSDDQMRLQEFMSLAEIRYRSINPEDKGSRRAYERWFEENIGRYNNGQPVQVGEFGGNPQGPAGGDIWQQLQGQYGLNPPGFPQGQG